MSRAAATRAEPGTRSRLSLLRPRWLPFAVVALVIVGAWLVIVFANALGDVDRASSRQRAIAAETAQQQARLDADKRELALVQTDAFQRLQARAYGLGAPGEIVFSLPADAPSPAPITPLGATDAKPTAADVETPLDAWLGLLFGR